MTVIFAVLWAALTCSLYPRDGLRVKRPGRYTVILVMHILGMIGVLTVELLIPRELQIGPIILVPVIPFWWHAVCDCITHIFLSNSTPGDTLP